jgi:hypothetical protein
MTDKTAGYKWLRLSFWCAAISLGASEAWATRFAMNPDGISYLDIGDAYWRRDWHNALNAYWSPLYSWILGFFLKVLKPSPYWEFPVAHLVNFLIYLAALACFEFFLLSVVAYQQSREAEDINEPYDVLPEWAWLVLGYTLFISCSISLITLSLVTPDMCVAALVYLTSGLLLRIRSGVGTRATFALLGLVLGVAYYAKSVMFVLAFPFLVISLFFRSGVRKGVADVLLATAIFFAVASPLIVALSVAKHRLTFGDSGAVNYEIFVDGVDVFLPEGSGQLHPARKISGFATIHEFAYPISGTYPLWYDTSYWHDGIKPSFNPKGQIKTIERSIVADLWLVVGVHFSFTLALLALVLIAPRPSRFLGRSARSWPITIPALSALVLYGLVYTEYRYIAAFVLLLWLAAFSGISLPASQGSRRLIGIAVTGIAAVTLFLSGRTVCHDLIDPLNSVSVPWEVASKLDELGIKPGDKLAVVAAEPFGSGGAFAARLARAQIVAQVDTPDVFWKGTATSRARLIGTISTTGVKAVLGSGGLPAPPDSDWSKVGDTSFYVLLLQ